MASSETRCGRRFKDELHATPRSNLFNGRRGACFLFCAPVRHKPRNHPFCEPSLTAVSHPDPETFDVAIVGLGPTGATLAALLGRMGMRVHAMERNAQVYPQPRAVGFDHDAMRIFQSIGVTEALEPHIAPFNVGEYHGVDGQVIRRVLHIDPPYPLSWAPAYTCDQPGVEACLRSVLTTMPNVRIGLGETLERFEQDGTGVRWTSRDANGRLRTGQAQFLVACDGASSSVRRALGIELDSLDYDESWVVVDVLVEPHALDQLPRTNVQYCEPARPCTFITCPGVHRRWEFMTLPGEGGEGAVSQERLWALLARWLRPGQASIWRAASYRFHALIARRWREGRVFLAGDSAHQTPPFLGQGMCQGLRDAGNLAWKLAAVLRGKAPMVLLESYERERSLHVAQTTHLAKDFGRIISERDPQRARERDARMLAEGGGQAQIMVRQEWIPGLREGWIDSASPGAGAVFPQPMVRRPGQAPCRLDDLTGPRWRLVCSVPPSADLAARLERLGLPIVVINRSDSGTNMNPGVQVVHEESTLLQAWFTRQGTSFVLVRPDHHVCGTYSREDAVLTAVSSYVGGSVE